MIFSLLIVVTISRLLFYAIFSHFTFGRIFIFSNIFCAFWEGTSHCKNTQAHSHTQSHTFTHLGSHTLKGGSRWFYTRISYLLLFAFSFHSPFMNSLFSFHFIAIAGERWHSFIICFVIWVFFEMMLMMLLFSRLNRVVLNFERFGGRSRWYMWPTKWYICLLINVKAFNHYSFSKCDLLFLRIFVWIANTYEYFCFESASLVKQFSLLMFMLDSKFFLFYIFFFLQKIFYTF